MIPMPQECVLSFILRVNLVLALRGMPQIINKKGQWARSITLNSKYQEFFSKLSDLQVAKLLFESGVLKHETDILKNPVSYTKDMENFLKGKRVAKYSSRDVKYCASCIREFIETYGFAYFKASWSREYCDYCSLHKEPFFRINSDNRKETLQALKLIMKGQRSNLCQSFRDSPYDYETIEDNHCLYVEKTENELPHLAICLKNKLKAWMLNEDHEFPSSLIKAVRCFDNQSIIRNMESHVFRDYVFRVAYYALHNSDYFMFHEFWKKQCEIYLFYCGVIKKSELRGEIAKLRGCNCSKCFFESCPANKMILWPRTVQRYSFQSYKCITVNMR